MVLVFLEVVGVDEDVIEVGGCKVLEVRRQGVINEILECRGHVDQHEGHYQ